ncbi:MAG: helix-turn-helix domain-containing protein [Rhodanobacter sp.]
MRKLSIAQRVGRNVRQHRLLTGLSQDNFADTIDMHRAYYSAIERGEKNITLVTLHRVAAGLGVTMAELLRDVDG